MSEFSDNHIHLVDPDPATAEWLQSHLADTDVVVTHFRSADDREERIEAMAVDCRWRHRRGTPSM